MVNVDWIRHVESEVHCGQRHPMFKVKSSIQNKKNAMKSGLTNDNYCDIKTSYKSFFLLIFYSMVFLLLFN